MVQKLDKSVEPSPLPKRKIAIGSLIFLTATIGVFVFLFSKTGGTGGPAWSSLRWEFGLLLLLALPLDPLATASRMYIVCRVLRADVSLWTCFKADCGNFAVSTLTPSQSGGGAAQVYLLHRAGVPMGTAWTVSMISFLGTLIGLAAIGLFALLFAKLAFVTGALFLGAVWVIALTVAAMALCAYAPGLFRLPIGWASRTLANFTRKTDSLIEWTPKHASDTPAVDRMGPRAARLVDHMYTYSRDVARFLKHGKLAFIGVVLTTLAFLVARALVAYLCLRFLGLDGALWEVLGIQMALMFVLYFSPTPGGAGIAESVSLVAMAAFVPTGFAPYYNLLWRFTTTYFWAIAGGLILARTFLRSTRLGKRHLSPAERKS